MTQPSNTLISKNNFFLFLLIPFLFFTNCSAQNVKNIEIINETNFSTKIKLGIDVLRDNDFDLLKGKRVGLITNPTGVDNKLKSTIDILHEAPNVNLVALFGPEHGVRGDTDAGKYIKTYVDEKTKLPVYSLYGKTRKPTKEMLHGIDVLVYDIQDIGCRSYTFISTMGLAMEAASENNIDFVVLDRPNPLGGNKIEGNIVESGYFSFISQFPIPYVYGLTCGELAKLLVNEKMIKTNNKFSLKVVPMQGWKREMNFDRTGLEWILTSPHIPHTFSAYFYPMTGVVGELRDLISIGVGYTLPFEIVGTEWIKGEDLANELNNRNIPGLYFRPISYTPYYAFGKGKKLGGVQIYIHEYDKVNFTKTQFYILDAIRKLYPEKDLIKLANERDMKVLNKIIGSKKVFELFENNNDLKKVFEYLDKDVQAFRELSKKYYLYK